MLFGLVCQNVFGTDCIYIYIYIYLKEYGSIAIFFLRGPNFRLRIKVKKIFKKKLTSWLLLTFTAAKKFPGNEILIIPKLIYMY